MTGYNRREPVFARFDLYKEMEVVAQCNPGLFQS